MRLSRQQTLPLHTSVDFRILFLTLLTLLCIFGPCSLSLLLWVICSTFQSSSSNNYRIPITFFYEESWIVLAPLTDSKSCKALTPFSWEAARHQHPVCSKLLEVWSLRKGTLPGKQGATREPRTPQPDPGGRASWQSEPHLVVRWPWSRSSQVVSTVSCSFPDTTLTMDPHLLKLH